jgi:hypothetical protein
MFGHLLDDFQGIIISSDAMVRWRIAYPDVPWSQHDIWHVYGVWSIPTSKGDPYENEWNI